MLLFYYICHVLNMLMFRLLKKKECDYVTEIKSLKTDVFSLTARLENTDQECLSIRDQLRVKVVSYII